MPSETTTACVSLLVFFRIRRGTFPYSVEDDASTISQTPTTHYTNTCVKLTTVTHLSFSERIAIANLSFIPLTAFHFRVYHATQWLTDGVNCRDSAGTVQEVPKLVPVTGAAFSGTTGQVLCASLFPHSLLVCSMVITYSRVWINRDKVANPARSQLNRENEPFSVPVRA